MSDNTDDMLRLLIERIERQEEEKKTISDSIQGNLQRGKVSRIRC
jgi:uncharacterized protein (UPF0335 family)